MSWLPAGCYREGGYVYGPTQQTPPRAGQRAILCPGCGTPFVIPSGALFRYAERTTDPLAGTRGDWYNAHRREDGAVRVKCPALDVERVGEPCGVTFLLRLTRA